MGLSSSFTAKRLGSSLIECYQYFANIPVNVRWSNVLLDYSLRDMCGVTIRLPGSWRQASARNQSWGNFPVTPQLIIKSSVPRPVMKQPTLTILQHQLFTVTPDIQALSTYQEFRIESARKQVLTKKELRKLKTL